MQEGGEVGREKGTDEFREGASEGAREGKEAREGDGRDAEEGKWRDGGREGDCLSAGEIVDNGGGIWGIGSFGGIVTMWEDPDGTPLTFVSNLGDPDFISPGYYYEGGHPPATIENNGKTWKKLAIWSEGTTWKIFYQRSI